MSLNKIIVMGRLTRDPEVRYTPSEKVVCSYTLAVQRDFKNPAGQREADFIPVVVWGKAAELCGNTLSKGHRVVVEGRLQIRSYDGKDGQKHWVSEIIASNVQFIEGRHQNAEQGTPAEAPKEAAPAPATAPAKAKAGSYQPTKSTAGSYRPAASSSKGQYAPAAKQATYAGKPTSAPPPVSPFDEEVPF